MVCAGPIAVKPSLQRQGVGSLLIREGIRWLRSKDAAGCILVGDLSYYSKFDFEARPELAPHGEPPEFFMVLPLRVAEPLSVITFHPLFREDQLRLLRPIA
jgi:putative acetyltransferase